MILERKVTYDAFLHFYGKTLEQRAAKFYIILNGSNVLNVFLTITL